MPARVSLDVTQASYGIRFDWGLEGMTSIATTADVVVFVDTLCFTTTVELMTSYGLSVVPYGGTGEIAATASSAGEIVAGRRGEPGLTLSPSSVTPAHLPDGKAVRIVLQSTNGSRIAAAAAESDRPTIAACFRNRTAVARWIHAFSAKTGGPTYVAVVAAGERRPDGTVRFAIEDQLAAGSVIEALTSVGFDGLSPEATVALSSFTSLKERIEALLATSVSGREIEAADDAADLALAARLDCSTTVPLLRNGAFTRDSLTERIEINPQFTSNRSAPRPQ